jgi:hypothetical protein
MSRIGAFIPWLLLLVTLTATGCEKTVPELRLADLTEAETFYVSRIVLLERAKAVALVDRPAGNALLDSLHAAWGDSALYEALAGAPTDPTRSNRVHGLLMRILEAERDSLVGAARPDRLTAPLPDPAPPAAEPEAEQ